MYEHRCVLKTLVRIAKIVSYTYQWVDTETGEKTVTTRIPNKLSNRVANLVGLAHKEQPTQDRWKQRQTKTRMKMQGEYNI